ncbi:DUF6308 family protein [Geodermatophilus sp. SYSU D00766]
MPDAVDRINEAVDQPYAGEHLDTYFHETGHIEGLPGFTGAWFERLGDPGPDDAFRLTGTDLGALSTLAVEVPAAVAIRLLHQHRPQIEELLARIPADVAIWDADDADIGPRGAAEELWALVRRTGDRKDTANRRTSAFKLCARKRPALLPVYDTEVEHFFPPENGNWWLTARRAMQQPALRERLSALHRDAAVPAQVTLLRTLDVVLWMEARHRRGGNCGHFRG